MNYMLFQQLRRLSGILKTTGMNLEKCYFRRIIQEEEDKVDITLLMKVKDSPRQFNFSRKPTENLQTLFVRIGANVQKAINKANKKKTGSDIDQIEVKMFTYDDDPVPVDSTCDDLFSLQGPLKLKIHDQLYEAVFNAPWIENINLPQSILAGFPVYPEHFQCFFTDQNESIFNWYAGAPINERGNAISDIHIKWELQGSGFSYTPSTHDIGKKLKLECIPGNNTSTGPAVETVSKNVVEAGPGRCPFETRHMFTTAKLKGKSFRCVSYNILADLYCDSDFTRTSLHPYCPPYALHIDYRKQLILKELLGYNPDILCLQEVDRKIFNHCLQPFLGASGLEGKFYKKGKEVAEGLSCFYSKDKFELIEEEWILLSEALKSKACLRNIWDCIKDNTPLRLRVLDRSTVASATVLGSIENPKELLIVANTHLYFHPDADHIRLLQGGMVIYWLREFKKELINKNRDKRVSLLLCGDFNSIPTCGIYQLFTSGKAPSSLPDWSSNANETVLNLSLEQDIPLESACGTPPFTNFTAGFADCLDYIFYEKSALEVEQVMAADLKTLGEIAAFPPPDNNETAWIAVLKSLDKHFPKDWRTWEVWDYPMKNLFDGEITSTVESKLRFAIPTEDLAKAFYPEVTTLSERAWRQVRKTFITWPIGRALLYSPHKIMEKVHERCYTQFMDAVKAVKAKVTSRKVTASQLVDNHSQKDDVCLAQDYDDGSQGKKRSRSRSIPDSEIEPPRSKRRSEPSRSPIRQGSSDHLLATVLQQQVQMFDKLLEVSMENCKNLKYLTDSKQQETLCNPPQPQDLNESFSSAADSTSSVEVLSEQEEQQLNQNKTSKKRSTESPMGREAELRHKIAEAQRELELLKSSDEQEDYEFDPCITAKEERLSKADPQLAKQAADCQRLGSESWTNVRYADVQKQFQAFPTFSALKVNNLLVNVTPTWSSVAILEKFDMALGAVANGLLQQRKIFKNLCDSLPDESRRRVGKDFLAADSEFKKKSDDLLQYVFGRRAEVLKMRRNTYKVKNKALNTILHEIPPSATHLFDEPVLDEVIKQQGGIHKFFSFSLQKREGGEKGQQIRQQKIQRQCIRPKTCKQHLQTEENMEQQN